MFYVVFKTMNAYRYIGHGNVPSYKKLRVFKSESITKAKQFFTKSVMLLLNNDAVHDVFDVDSFKLERGTTFDPVIRVFSAKALDGTVWKIILCSSYLSRSKNAEFVETECETEDVYLSEHSIHGKEFCFATAITGDLPDDYIVLTTSLYSSSHRMFYLMRQIKWNANDWWGSNINPKYYHVFRTHDLAEDEYENDDDYPLGSAVLEDGTEVLVETVAIEDMTDECFDTIKQTLEENDNE